MSDDTDPTTTDEIAARIAKLFVSRRDAKALQSRSGAYVPVTDTGKPDGKRLPWTMGDFRSHLRGDQTFGHYLVSKENTAKVFCFDLDLEEELKWAEPKRPPKWSALMPGTDDILERSGDARKAWRPMDMWNWCPTCRKGWYEGTEQRCTNTDHLIDSAIGSNPDTVALTGRLQETAFALAGRAFQEFEIPVAISYSGNKGLHVYGFVGEQSAADVRLAAHHVLDTFDHYQASRGTNFFRDTDEDFEAISVEVFPKQDSLEGKDLGNLLRLPLGVNRKTGHRGFFLRYGAYGQLSELDPMVAMEGDLWL